MSPFEYLSVLISVIVGLSVTHLLVTAARLIQRRRQVRLYVPTLVWMATLFIVQIQIWWVAYAGRGTGEWTFLSFLGMLVIPILGFLLCYLAVPELEDGGVDLRASYYDNRVWFFGIIAAMVAFTLLRDVTSGGIPFSLDTAFRLGILAFAVVSILVRNAWFHALNAWVALTVFCLYIASEFLKLR